ncbi:hypothetical protein E2C01_069363 [Portunus trituberculatus]|uniref:Uncharacterized protein n=1 Tax=Portunus trituberculatus TaxID=210409 RepID=A0A5B7HRD4_PORTR|nr:hypothetical protein [Portunus trituberculatus]
METMNMILGKKKNSCTNKIRSDSNEIQKAGTRGKKVKQEVGRRNSGSDYVWVRRGDGVWEEVWEGEEALEGWC